jgi:hypothetical protein
MKRIMINSLYVLTGLVLTASLALTGCTSKEPTTQELSINASTAMQKVSSYKLDYNMTLDMDITGGINPMKMSMDGIGTGAMDVSNKKMQMILDVNADIPGPGTSQMNMKMSMEMYMIEGWLYTKMAVPGAGVQWSKMEIPDTTSQDQVAQLMILLESAIETKLQGSEKVNGVDCYILEVVPDMEALWQWVMSQQGSSFAGTTDFSQFDLSKVIKDFGLKYWIGKSNYQIIKGEAKMTIDVDAESLDLTTEEFESMTMIMNYNMTFSDYNKAVTIELPTDAQNAQEVTP